MEIIRPLLLIIVCVLVVIFWELIKINARLKDRFPTEKEQDRQRAMGDPAGHSEAHQKDKK